MFVISCIILIEKDQPLLWGCTSFYREENLFGKKLNPQIRIYLILIGKLKVYAYITFVYTQVSTLGSGILQACQQWNRELCAHVSFSCKVDMMAIGLEALMTGQHLQNNDQQHIMLTKVLELSNLTISNLLKLKKKN